MGRTLSGIMSSILAASAHTFDWTVDLNFPDTTSKHVATAPLTISMVNYTNDLENVSELRQTLEDAVNTVSVEIQNKDRVLGLDVAANKENWRNCEAVIGRYYRDDVGLGLSEWVEMFRGTVQQPKPNDQKVPFDVIIDTIAPGLIVCNWNLDPNCPFLFKEVHTCAYAGGLTTCNHHLKSPDGCDGRANTHHYGGMEHRYNPDTIIPGSGGDPTGGGGGDGGGEDHPPCPRADQFVRISGADGERAYCQAKDLKAGRFLWHPVKREYRKVRSAEIVADQPIWELVTANGSVGYSSHPHPVLWFKEHSNGAPVLRFVAGDPVLTVIGDNDELVDSAAVISQDTGETADVVRIELEGELEEDKIYCWGDSAGKMIACHNTKIIT